MRRASPDTIHGPAPAPAPRATHRPGVLLLALLGAAAGCDRAGTPADEAVSRAEFIDVVVALREAERELIGEDSASARFQARKVEILAEHDVTEAELEAFIRETGRAGEALAEVWDSIAERLRHLPPPTLDAVRAPSDPIP